MAWAAQWAERLFSKGRPPAVYAHMPPYTPEQRAVASLARHLHIPVIIRQHGGGYGVLDHPGHYWHELAHCDRWLAHSFAVIEGLRLQFGGRPLPQFVVEGTPRDDATPPGCPDSSSRALATAGQGPRRLGRGAGG